MEKKNIMITGGAGYVGSALVPDLLSQGHNVCVLDLCIYGDDVLDSHPNLKIIKGDIRDIRAVKNAVEGCDTVIHLACISNDPSFELNPTLGRSINLDAFQPLVEASRAAGVDRFVYASSSSVYGIKDELDVHEGMSLEPLTDYSKFKAECETILAKYQSESFTTVTIRPATVCGFARRQRLDVVVNILSNLAFHNRKIKIFGGAQLRPNINIKDMVGAYNCLLSAEKELVAGKVFNAGFENHSVEKLGEIVVGVVGEDVAVERVTTDDNRSYHVSSKKIAQELGFVPSYDIEDAVKGLVDAFEQGRLSNPMDNPMYVNIKRMQEIDLQ